MATLLIEPTSVEPSGSYTITVSGFVDGGDYVYIDFLSGPPEFGPYPKAAYRFPAVASGSYTTDAPSIKGTYVAVASQGTLLSNEVTISVTYPLPQWLWLAIPFALVAVGIVYYVTKKS